MPLITLCAHHIHTFLILNGFKALGLLNFIAFTSYLDIHDILSKNIKLLFYCGGVYYTVTSTLVALLNIVYCTYSTESQPLNDASESMPDVGVSNDEVVMDIPEGANDDVEPPLESEQCLRKRKQINTFF